MRTAISPSLSRRAWLRVCAGLLLSVGCIGQASAADRIQAQLGFGQQATDTRYRADSWNPLTVRIASGNLSGEGQLQVTVRSGRRSTLTTRRILLTGQTTVARLAVYVPTPDTYDAIPIPDITVRLFKDGRQLAEEKAIIPLQTPGLCFNVLALTTDPDALNFLTKKKLGLVHRHTNPTLPPSDSNVPQMQSAQPQNWQEPVQVMHTDAEQLPESAQAYDMVDAIVVGNQPLESLTSQQQEALKGYVRGGGLLILTGINQFQLEGLYASLTQYNQYKRIAGLISSYLPDIPQIWAERYPAPSSKMFDVIPAPKLANSYSLWRDTHQFPVVAMLPYGSGRAVCVNFDLLYKPHTSSTELESVLVAPRAADVNAVTAFWRDLLQTGNNALSARDKLQKHTLDYNHVNFVDALAGKQATNAPSIWLVGLFLAAYLLLLIPGSYLVLKKLDRRELAWVTSPLLILGFVGASYVIGISIKGGTLTVNRAVVLETQANSDQVAGYAQMTLYSPHRAAYDIALGNPDDPNNPYRNVAPREIIPAQNSRAQASDLTIEQDKTTVLRGTVVKQWDTRSFETPVQTSLGGPITVKTQPIDHDNLKLAITNNTKYALKNCGIVYWGAYIPIGELAPGQTYQGSVSLNQINFQYSLPLPSPIQNSTEAVSNGTPEQERRKICSALADILRNTETYGFDGTDVNSYGTPAFALVGWFDDPLLDVRVDGKTPQGVEANLLVVHLPAPKNFDNNPFARKPILHFEDVDSPRKAVPAR